MGLEKMGRKVAITTSSFGQFDQEPLDLLKENSLEFCLNPFKRAIHSDETISLLRGCCAVLAGTEIYNKEILMKLKDLKVISRVGVGLDNIDQKAIEDLGIKLYTTHNEHAQAVAELVIGYIFDLLRHITISHIHTCQGNWQKRMGSLVKGKKLSVLGYGRIGQAVGRLASALGLEVFYYDPFVRDARLVGKFVEFDQLLKEADILTLHLNYSEDKYHLIGKEELSWMKTTSYLINTSRGSIIDEEALHGALKEKKIAGAALDVFEKEPYNGPLKNLDNVLLTPHMGAYAKEARIQMEKQAVLNLLEGLREVDFLNEIKVKGER